MNLLDKHIPNLEENLIKKEFDEKHFLETITEL
jgi:hypothetical protein